jgi:hypothetical protein
MRRIYDIYDPEHGDQNLRDKMRDMQWEADRAHDRWVRRVFLVVTGGSLLFMTAAAVVLFWLGP